MESSCRVTPRMLFVLSFAFLAFWGAGVALHRACDGREPNELGWVSVDGYDSEAYLTQFTRIGYVFDVNHRHPLMKPLMSPVFAVGTAFAERIGPEAGKVAVLGCFAALATLALALLRRIVADAGADSLRTVAVIALWLSFAHVWLLGGMAESFGASTLLLLVAVRMRQTGVRDPRAWIALTAVTAGVTVTNGVKPLLAWAPGRRTLFRLALAAAACLLLASAALVAKWLLLDGYTVAQGIGFLTHDVGTGFAALTPARRVWFAWNAFCCEPLVLHGPVVSRDVLREGYSWCGPHLLVACVFALAAAGAWSRRGDGLVRFVLLSVACDVVLHLIVGWGVSEGQIYCGHWFWALPALVASAPGRRTTSIAVIVIALLVAAENLRVVLS